MGPQGFNEGPRAVTLSPADSFSDMPQQFMHAAAPNLDIHLVEQDLNDSLVDLLIAGEIDVTFLEGPYNDSRLELIELGADPFVVLLPRESDLTRLAKGKTFPTRLLAQAPMVGEHDCSTQTPIDVGLRDAGITPRNVFRASDNGAIQGMVRAVSAPPSCAYSRSSRTTPALS